MPHAHAAPTARSTAGGAIPRPRALAVCIVCAALFVRPTREAAREAERAHWRRVHDRKET